MRERRLEHENREGHAKGTKRLQYPGFRGFRGVSWLSCSKPLLVRAKGSVVVDEGSVFAAAEAG